MKLKSKKRLVATAISLLTFLTTAQSSFAHNAVYYDFLVSNNMQYDLIVRDDPQTSTEAGHYEFTPKIGGYFYNAGINDKNYNTRNRPLFVYSEDYVKEYPKTPTGDVAHRHPGYIKDPTAPDDRIKYYTGYTTYRETSIEGSKGEQASGIVGNSYLGKVFTLPPTNAYNTNTKKVMHMDATNPDLSEVTKKLIYMMNAFNLLLEKAAPGDQEGVYSSVERDFMATAEILADAISNTSDGKTVVVPIPTLFNSKWEQPPTDNSGDGAAYDASHLHNSVRITIKGRRYDAFIVRYDGKAYSMQNAIRTVSTGFKQSGAKGDYIINDTVYKQSSDVDKSSFLKSWFGSGWVKSTSGVPARQDYPFREDIQLVTCIVAANTKFCVWGIDSSSSYISRDDSILARELTKAINNVTDALKNLLKLQSYSELIFNSGVRNPDVLNVVDNPSEENKDESISYSKNDPYFLGIYRNSWHKTTDAFSKVFVILGIMVILFSMVKLLLHAQTIAISPYFRSEAYKTVLNFFLIAVLMPSSWMIFWVLAKTNYYIVDIFGISVGYQSISEIGATGASGSLGAVIISVCYFTMLVYFNVVYVMRSVNIAILMATAPAIISTLALGGRYSNMFTIWLKELCANIFLQSFHAFILTFIVSVQIQSSGIEALILVIAMVPLTSMFRSLFIGGSTVGGAENQGRMAQHATTGLLAAGTIASFKIASSAVGASVGAVGAFNRGSLKKTEDMLQKQRDNGTFDMNKSETKDLLSKRDKLQKRIERTDNLKPRAQAAVNALGAVTSGVALAGATEGRSLMNAASGIANLAEIGIGAASGSIDSIIEKGMSGENKKDFTAGTKELHKKLDSIHADKDTKIARYNMDKEDKKAVEAILNKEGASYREKNQLLKNYLDKQGIDTKGIDVENKESIVYDKGAGQIQLTGANKGNYTCSTIGDKVLVTKFNNPKAEIPDTARYYNNTNRETAMTMAEGSGSNLRTLESTINNGEAHVSYDSSGEKKKATGAILREFEQNGSGNQGTYKIGTNENPQFNNLAKIEATPESIVATYNLSDNQKQVIQQKMQAAGDDWKAQEAARNAYIKSEFGEQARFNYATGQVTIKEANNSNFVEMSYNPDTKEIVGRTLGDSQVQYDRQSSSRTTHTVGQAIEFATANNNNNACKSITIDSRVLTPSSDLPQSQFIDINSAKYNASDKSATVQFNSSVNTDLQNKATELKQLYSDNINKQQTELSYYASSKYGVDNIDINSDGNYTTKLNTQDCYKQTTDLANVSIDNNHQITAPANNLANSMLEHKYQELTNIHNNDMNKVYSEMNKHVQENYGYAGFERVESGAKDNSSPTFNFKLGQASVSGNADRNHIFYNSVEYKDGQIKLGDMVEKPISTSSYGNNSGNNKDNQNNNNNNNNKK